MSYWLNILKKVTFKLFFNIFIASPFNAFEFPSGSPQAIGTTPEKSETAALPGIYFKQISLWSGGSSKFGIMIVKTPFNI